MRARSIDRRRAGLTRRSCIGAAVLVALPAYAQQQAVVKVAGSRIELIFDEGFDEPAQAAVQRWVARAAKALAGYLGHFPLPRTELYLRAAEGTGPRRGTTFAEPEPFVSVQVGRQTREAHLADDWILVHEFVHLAVPRVPRYQNWLHEGLATYVEGVARARSGWTDPARFWAEMVRGLPQGLPQAGDRGLDHTPTWGRTYWGGALFCLLAEVRTRQLGQTGRGLQEALHSLRDAGGSYAVAWPVPRLLRTFDAAVSYPGFSEQYAAMKDKPMPVDLPALWRRLGITLAAGSERAAFDDQAPLAAVRRAIAG